MGKAEREQHTELETAVIALQVSEARWRGVFESTSDAILTADVTQKIVSANPAAARMFRCRVDELVGAPLERLLPDRLRARHRIDVDAFGESPISTRQMGRRPDVIGLRCDGEEFVVDASISHVHVDGQRLYTAILRDVTERRRAEAELAASKAEIETSHAALRRLVAAFERVQEEERRRIARELHDDLQQTLAAIMIEVGALRAASAAGVPAPAATPNTIERLAGSAIESTRRIVNDLRPRSLEELGLVPALESLAARFASSRGIRCEFATEGLGPDDDLRDSPLATCLYRVAQECLNNVAKHAHASRVQMRLVRASDGGLILRVIDDGHGMRPQDRQKVDSFGLLGMHERVHALGGSLRVTSRLGDGTQLEASLPPLPPPGQRA
jgi:PAS domain S-box-containing protein